LTILLGIDPTGPVRMAPRDLADLASAAGHIPQTLHRRILQLKVLYVPYNVPCFFLYCSELFT
jgi:hypothetical protein